MKNNINPFNITKAVDYSDIEIDRYWVDMPGGNGFADIIKPESPMPIMILGGKGSGKTHIMRYFSYNLQKIRYGQDLLKTIQDKKYIGVFLRCGGLNSSKFDGESQTADAWKNIFSYYFELWLGQLVTNILQDIFIMVPGAFEKYEASICKEIAGLFDEDVFAEFRTLETFKIYLQKLQKKVDYEVNNCAITGKKITETRILVSPGKMIFGIPDILVKTLPFLNGVQFIYLIDEYENLLEYQQKYINTLIRERETPVSFRIGARWYGIKTYQTYSGDEKLKVGSEYDKIIIDELLRERKENYNEFAKKICVSRLEEAGFINKLNRDAEHVKETINEIASYFEEFNLEEFQFKLQTKNGKHKQPYFNTLREDLKKIKEPNIDDIIWLLSFDSDYVLERTNVFLFYREWNDGSRNLKDSAERIQEDCLRYTEDTSNKTLPHNIVLEKFRGDIIDQLHRENREKLPYSGIEKLVKMSAGIPRHLLIMLKHVYRWSKYNGEAPFNNQKISTASQYNGIEDAIKWFLDDARVPGPLGKPIAGTIDRIGQLMHIIRFSNVPPECSISTFSINSSDINDSIQEILDYLEQYSYLIKAPERREKNSSVQRITYKINGLIAPNWELPISTRGVLPLSKKEVAAIFNTGSDDEFNKIKTDRKNKYNAPFKQNTGQQTIAI